MRSRILIFAFIFIMFGCASRKSNVEINKTVDKETNERSLSGQVKQTEESKSSESNQVKNDKEGTETTTTTNEKFNSDGTINERTTTTSNKRMIDKTVTTYNRITSTIKTMKIRYKITERQMIYRTTYIKQKSTHANNYGWIAFALVVVYLIYIKFAKPKHFV